MQIAHSAAMHTHEQACFDLLDPDSACAEDSHHRKVVATATQLSHKTVDVAQCTVRSLVTIC